MSDVVVQMQPDPIQRPSETLVNGNYVINDRKFNQLQSTLTDLCHFMQREGVSIPPEKAHLLVVGKIGRLRKPRFWSRETGRVPTEAEWGALETRLQELHSLLGEPCRRGFYISQSKRLLIWMPLVIMVGAVASLFATSFIDERWHLYCYIAWLMALGALGSIAYISMNALSLQKDITFDIGNKRLLVIRILLGAMFGLILALPFGFGNFESFIRTLRNNTPSDAATDAKTAATLLMPFVFGFSTTLVLTIINRLVDAIGVIFGKPPTSQSSNMSH
ncbi:hypothetical protein ACH79_39770 [Bradyrhizobium sp. CCBAU 051011]|uniref:hypothetical protein n=1 Tax=Bradyrhizobium sp. CCBAU 051011 TaxID=858422 RepID=UPI0013739FBB|nr:hypothetical protein [Bradyrhizobium sp. CCBAU 051011]QHO77835.1 hypothetical protein ACH79_39770 [Bradyrhizobium sp. CCBAU 051011]